MDMHTRRKHTRIYRAVFFLLIGTAFWYFWQDRPVQQERNTHPRPPEHTSPPLTEIPQFIVDIQNHPPLSSDAARRFERLKKEAHTHAAKLTNADIEFSVTLSLKRPPEVVPYWVDLLHWGRNALMPPKETPRVEKPPIYDVVGVWTITYRVEGDTEIFDIKAHKKRQMDRSHIFTRMPDGSGRFDMWQETHHRFMRKRKQTLYIQDGAVWKPFKKWRLSRSATQPEIAFDPRFNPLWWCFGHDTPFDTFILRHKITAVKTIDTGGSPQVYLQAYRTEKVQTTHRATTIEIYMHPQAGVYPKRILTSFRSGGPFPVYKEGFLSRPKPVPGKYTYGEGVNVDVLTSELAHYGDGIWFPKTVREEYFSTPESDLIAEHARTPESLRDANETAPAWKRVMKVHRAVFNTPKPRQEP